MRSPRPTLGGGIFILGVIVCAYACHSPPGAGTGTGGAGTTGHAGTTGGGGTTGTGGKGGEGGDGTGGSAATAGKGGMGGDGGIGGSAATGGKGGMGGACNGAGGSESGMSPCGPAPTCDGNTAVIYQYCDQRACSGSWGILKRTPCPDGTTCGGGKCLTHVTPPAKTCAMATDCGLPATVCFGASEQLIFSDPSCDDGQCHWEQIVNRCGMAGVNWQCTSGTCYDPGALTRGPYPPMPSPDPMQPPPAPDHACATAADCPQPPATCFYDSVVSYVQPACRAGACSWEIDLNECAGLCSGGACVAP